MIILAIETSCDDTCAAILKIENVRLGRRFLRQRRTNWKLEILSNVVSSQEKLHQKYGGVYPFLAKREHQKNLPLVYEKALQQAQSKQKFEKPDLIAVTVGPGLEPCLWTGVNFAKDLAKKLKLPIIPVNHIEAHIFANWLPPFRSKLKISSKAEDFFAKGEQIKSQKLKVAFPAVCLVVSGGHTQLIFMRNFGKYKILGETRDDAAGECFDKAARILGLGYPGGPAIALWAAKSRRGRTSVNLPRPMIGQKNYDFSFSGLKTAVLYDYQAKPEKVRKSKRYIQEMSGEIQQAIIDVLINKTLKAVKNSKAKTIILGGGVTANKELRKQFKKAIRKELPKTYYLIPDISYCTDNAAMVAVAGYFQWQREGVKNWQNIEADGNLKLGFMLMNND